MIFLHKNIRYYYWLIFGFIKKNLKFIILSFIFSFFLILLLINFFPYLNLIFIRKKEKIGMVGKYTFKTLPEEILNLISNPLIIVSKGEIIPILANSWEISSDGKNYRFHLKPNLVWSDGEQFTAHDLNYQFKDVFVKPFDNLIIDFKLKKPLAIFPIYLTKPIIKYPLKGIGGLYHVENYQIKSGYFTTINLYPNKEGLPYKIYKFYETEEKQILGYKKGEINLIKTYKLNTANFFSSWKNTRVKKNTDYSQILTLFFNTNSKIFSSKDVRRALAYLIPSFNYLGEQSFSPISPLSWAYSSSLKKYNFNEEKGIALFKKNYQSSNSAEIDFYTFYEYIDVAEKIKENFEKTGLKINLQVISYFPQKFDLFLTMWHPPIDPDQYYIWHSSQSQGNITGYKNLKVDKLLEDGRNTIDVEERKKIYRQFQEVIMDDLPAYFIYYPYVYTIERK